MLVSQTSTCDGIGGKELLTFCDFNLSDISFSSPAVDAQTAIQYLNITAVSFRIQEKLQPTDSFNQSSLIDKEFDQSNKISGSSGPTKDDLFTFSLRVGKKTVRAFGVLNVTFS